MTGKISRLPLEIRRELSRRLDTGQTAKSLVPWLNSLPEVQAVLAAEFAGLPINEVNLCKWKAREHRQWTARRDFLENAPQNSQFASELSRSSGQSVTDGLAAALSIEHFSVLSDLDRGGDDTQQQIRILASLSRDIAALRLGDYRNARREQIERHHWQNQEFKMLRLLEKQMKSQPAADESSARMSRQYQPNTG